MTKKIVTESIPPKIVKISDELSCDLNDVEWQNRARELADAQKFAEQTEERKKSVMADLNSDLKIAKLKVSKLANVVSNRRELREVTVEIKYDYELGLVTKIRTDTGEKINEREMIDSERQQELLDADDFIASRHEDELNEDE